MRKKSGAASTNAYRISRSYMVTSLALVGQAGGDCYLGACKQAAPPSLMYSMSPCYIDVLIELTRADVEGLAGT